MFKQLLALSAMFACLTVGSFAAEEGSVKVNLNDDSMITDVTSLNESEANVESTESKGKFGSRLKEAANENYDFALWAPTQFSPRISREDQITNRDRLLEFANVKATVYWGEEIFGELLSVVYRIITSGSVEVQVTSTEST